MTSTPTGTSVHRLVEVMRRLLADDGCPWDREQTLMTLRPYIIEEAHEVVEAIDRESPLLLREELGDLLLQVVFSSELSDRAGHFDLDGVVDGICEKLVRRHPHVFGSADASDAGEALANWEQIKKKEKGDRGALDGVPKALPSLLRAIRVGEKASAVGYDWPNAEGAREKIDEELRELDAAATEAPERLEEELGDLLFSIANFARKRKLDPEAALRGALDRFTGRFEYAEQIAKERGASLSDLGAEELDELWERAKDQAAQR